MARIRTIKPEFWQDEKLAPLDPLTRLVFLGLISMADDAGRVLDSVKAIDGFLFPLSNDSAHEPLMTLSRIGRIRRGRTASGQQVIQLVNWERHQRVQHPQLAAALPEIVDTTEDSGAHEPLMNGSRGAPEPLAPHSNDLRPTTNDLRPTTDEDEDDQAAASAALPEAVVTALEPYLRSARIPAAVVATVKGEMQGLHGTAWTEATVVQALTDMQAAGVSPFAANAFRGFLRGVASGERRERERKADDHAKASREEGERHKQETPRTYRPPSDGLPPDQVPSMADLLRAVAPGLLPEAPSTLTPAEREQTAAEKAAGFRQAAEVARREKQRGIA